MGHARVVEREVACECGFRVIAIDVDVLVEAARRHAEDEHGIVASPELVLAIATVVPSEDPPAPKAPHERA